MELVGLACRMRSTGTRARSRADSASASRSRERSRSSRASWSPTSRRRRSTSRCRRRSSRCSTTCARSSVDQHPDDLAQPRRCASSLRRVAVMYLGRIVEVGAARRALRRPSSSLHAGAAGRRAADPRGAGQARLRLRGEPPSATARPSGCAFHPRCPRAEEICSTQRPELEPIQDSQLARAACHFRNDRP